VLVVFAASGRKIVEVIAFFDTIEFTDFWQRITP